MLWVAHLDQSEEIRRGEQAALVLDSEIYKAAFQSVRDGIVAAWENAPVRDKEGQHELKLMLKLLNDVQKNLETTMQSGKMAKIQVERENMFRRAQRVFKG